MRGWVSLALAGGSGLALAAAFTGVWTGAAWLALAPVFYLVAAAASWWQALWFAWAFSLCYLIASFNFVAHQTLAGLLALGLYSSLYPVAALLGTRWLARRSLWAAVFGSAACWTLTELLRARCPVFGFPWALLGQATWQTENLKQVAELFGVYGLSFLLAAWNALLAFVAVPLCWGRLSAPPGEERTRRLCLVWVLLLLLASLVFGRVRVAELSERMTRGPALALLQGCAYQKERDRTEEVMRTQLEDHLALHRRAVAEAPRDEAPGLICWAETMVPGLFNRDRYAERLQAQVRAFGIPTICGSDWVHEQDLGKADEYEQRWYNSALVLDGSGKLLGRYAKRKLVPFGEYVPFGKEVPLMKIFRSVTRDTYTHGEEPSPVVPVAGLRVALNICVEDTHPQVACEAAKAGADCMFNLTNDGWFRGTSGPEAHLQAASFRAIEARMPLIRVTNSGWSVQVDPLGRVEWPLAPDRVGIVRLQVRRLAVPFQGTFAVWLGDLGVGLFFAVVLGALIAVRPARVSRGEVPGAVGPGRRSVSTGGR